MKTALVLAAAQVQEEHRDLPIPSWGFGLIAFGALMLMLIVCLSFRGTSYRH